MKKTFTVLPAIAFSVGIIALGFLSIEVSKDFSSIVSLQTAEAQPQQIVYHGDVSSKVFHRPECKHYNCVTCIHVLKSREEAIRLGYRPCRICNP